MLANALLCPDLQDSIQNSNYKHTTFYFDTPLLVRVLGLTGPYAEQRTKNLLSLLQKLGGRCVTFSHLLIELEDVLRGAAANIDRPEGRGRVVLEARRQGVTPSDLLLLASNLNGQLQKLDIAIEATPRYTTRYQVDEDLLGNLIDAKISYRNPHARTNDINSVRSIYALRRGLDPVAIEKSRAVLVTSNSGLSESSTAYAREHEQQIGLPPLIVDFSLANAAWIKAPMGASDLPTTEVLAYAYAALQPTDDFLNKFLEEIEKLSEKSDITSRDHQLLRSDHRAYFEIMDLTLGDDSGLNFESISATLTRVSEEIRQEESRATSAKQSQKERALEELKLERERNRNVADRLYWQCDRDAERAAWIATSIPAVFVVLGIATGFGLHASAPVAAWALWVGSAFLLLAGVISSITEFHLVKLHSQVKKWVRLWLLRRRAAELGIELPVFDLSEPG